MSDMRFRLPLKPDRRYSGRAINRDRSIKFTLDGHAYTGFEGDSVLSAVLANGTDTFGFLTEEPMALDEHFHPPLSLAGKAHDPKRALAMDRTPIVDGMELVSLAETDTQAGGFGGRLAAGWQKLRAHRRASLGLDPQSVAPFPGPWQELDPEQDFSADLLVIGGGTAGLSAAREGVDKGWSVILVDQSAEPGGDAEYFGGQEGEDNPKAAIARLHAELAGSDRVQFFMRTRAFSLSAGTVRAHQIRVDGPLPTGRVIGLLANNVVLATGAHERLPLFSGNRLPGVIGARTAHRWADRYGVWRGTKAVISTTSNAAVQVALGAADADVEIVRLADCRIAPESRFFDFAKAYGVPLATGLQVADVRLADGAQLNVSLRLSMSGAHELHEELQVDRLVVCGGWQPDLALWHMAGGRADWVEDTHQLKATGELDHVALAGSGAGALGLTNCIEQAREAVCGLAGVRVSGGHKNRLKNPESADGPLPISRPVESAPGCFLDSGYTFSQFEPHEQKRGFGKFFWQPVDQSEADLRALSLSDVTAKVLLGEIPVEQAGTFAKERCVVPIELGGADQTPPTDSAASRQPSIPAYLKGRFGGRERIVRLVASEGRGAEPGCLVFANSNDTRPDQSLGVVLSDVKAANHSVLACMGARLPEGLNRVIARNGAQTMILSLSGDSPPD